MPISQAEQRELDRFLSAQGLSEEEAMRIVSGGDAGQETETDTVADPIAEYQRPEFLPKDRRTWGRYLINLSTQAAQGLTFNTFDEAMYYIDRMAGTPEEKALAKWQAYNKYLGEEQTAYPVSSFGANVAGSVLTGAGAAKALGTVAPGVATKAAQFARANPVKTAIATGAGGNLVYTAGQGEGDLSERVPNPLGTAAIGGAGGYLGLKAAGAISGAVDALSQKFPGASKAISSALGYTDDPIGGPVADTLPIVPQARVTPHMTSAAQSVDDPVLASTGAAGVNVEDLTPLRLAGVFNEDDLARMEQGKILPMTKGERTQDVALQRAEDMAFKTGSRPIIGAVSKRNVGIQKKIGGILGDDQIFDDPSLGLRVQTEAENAANILRGQYDSLKGRVNRAYEVARETGEGVGISAEAVKNNFLDDVYSNLAANEYRKGDIPELDKHLKELMDIVSPVSREADDVTAQAFKVTDVKLKALEGWKRRLNNIGVPTSGPLSYDAGMRIKTIASQKYDEFLTNLADDAIVNGDFSAIDAFKNARGLAREKFKFYESDKAIAKILDSRELSGEQLVNTIYGLGRMTGKGDDGLLTSKMVALAGDKAPEMTAALQRGAVSKILKSSISSQPKDPIDDAFNLISWGKMRSEVSNLMQKKEFFQTVFSDEEQKWFKTLYKDLDKIASKQSGSINPSGTGTWTADMMVGLAKVINNPVFSRTPGINVATGGVDVALQNIAENQVRGVVESPAYLKEFTDMMINSIDTRPIYWGGGFGGIYGEDASGLGLDYLTGQGSFKNEEEQ